MYKLKAQIGMENKVSPVMKQVQKDVAKTIEVMGKINKSVDDITQTKNINIGLKRTSGFMSTLETITDAINRVPTEFTIEANVVGGEQLDSFGEAIERYHNSLKEVTKYTAALAKTPDYIYGLVDDVDEIGNAIREIPNISFEVDVMTQSQINQLETNLSAVHKSLDNLSDKIRSIPKIEVEVASMNAVGGANRSIGRFGKRVEEVNATVNSLRDNLEKGFSVNYEMASGADTALKQLNDASAELSTRLYANRKAIERLTDTTGDVAKLSNAIRNIPKLKIERDSTRAISDASRTFLTFANRSSDLVTNIELVHVALKQTFNLKTTDSIMEVVLAVMELNAELEKASKNEFSVMFTKLAQMNGLVDTLGIKAQAGFAKAEQQAKRFTMHISEIDKKPIDAITNSIGNAVDATERFTRAVKQTEEQNAITARNVINHWKEIDKQVAEVIRRMEKSTKKTPLQRFTPNYEIPEMLKGFARVGQAQRKFAAEQKRLAGDPLYQMSNHWRNIGMDINDAKANLRATNSEGTAFKYTVGEIGTSVKNTGANIYDWQYSLFRARQVLGTIQMGLDQIRKLTDMSDQDASVRARLQMMAAGVDGGDGKSVLQVYGDGDQAAIKQAQDSVDDLYQKIYHSSQRARVSFNDQMNAVARLGMLAGDAFDNTDQVIAFSETVQKTFALSGASIEEQASAMHQLTQAMASNRLQGDEFVSIMENAPLIAQTLVDYLGVTKGELKELSSEGELTAEVVFKAIMSSQEAIEEMFAQMPMTFAQAMEQMGNTVNVIFDPISEKISNMVNSEWFEMLMNLVIRVTATVGATINVILHTIDIIMTAVQFIYELLEPLHPILHAVIDAVVIAAGAFMILSVAVFVATAISKLFGVVMAFIAENPIVKTIMAISVVIMTIINLWKTSAKFKFFWLNLWDSIVYLATMGGIKILDVTSKISMGFRQMGITVLGVVESTVNKSIDFINKLISLVNKIPGVSIEAIGNVNWTTTRQAALNKDFIEQRKEINQMELDAKARRNASRAQRLQEQRQMEADLAAAAEGTKYGGNWGQLDSGALGNLADSIGSLPDIGKIGSGGIPKVGKVGSIGKIEDDVTIAEEDLKLLKDVSAHQYLNTYNELTPDIKIEVHGNDTDENIDAIRDAVATSLEESFGTILTGK